MFEFHSDWKVIVNSIPFLRYLVLFSDMRTFSEDEGKEEANNTKSGVRQSICERAYTLMLTLYAMCWYWQTFFREPQNPDNTLITTSYADDCDFISTDPYTFSIINVLLPTYFIPWKLSVNQQKTEWHTISKGSNFSIPKFGSNVRTDLDIKNKLIKATIAFKKLHSLWFRPHLTREQLRIRIYNAYVPPILRYNLHTTGLTQLQLNILDTYHRKQLRFICRIFYPARISNSIMIIEQRWKLFGHTLRLPTSTFHATILYHETYR